MLVDDERLARQAMRQLLVGVEDVEIVGEADGVAAARELIEQANPHGIFLDVQMPRADGFELPRGLVVVPKIVFVTAHAEHAVRAFEVEAVDYLLKPVRAGRLASALERLRLACGMGGGEERKYEARDRICLRTPGRTVVAALDKVAALQADGDFTQVFVADEPPLMICQALGAYERILPNPPFLRVDRSLMVNVGAVSRSKRRSRDELWVWLNGKADPVTLGRTAQARLREALDG
jgi:two-component system LytT family response regulator